MNTKPVYQTTSSIARTLGYNPRQFGTTVDYWRKSSELPPPEPDAYSEVKDGYRTPLWLPTRLPEWQTWDRERQTRRWRKSYTSESRTSPKEEP